MSLIVGVGVGVEFGGKGAAGAPAAPTITTVYTPFGETVAGWKRALKGSGFSVSTPTITIGGVACTSVTVIDDNNLTYVGPAGIATTAAQDLVLSTLAGSVTKTGAIWIATGTCLGLYDTTCRTGVSGLNTLWQDTARTSAFTTSGQSIAGVSDLSSAGHHLSQPTPGDCPVGSSTGLDGAATFGVVHDGVNDVLFSAAFGTLSTACETFWCNRYITTGSNCDAWAIADSGVTRWVRSLEVASGAIQYTANTAGADRGANISVNHNVPHAYAARSVFDGATAQHVVIDATDNTLATHADAGSVASPQISIGGFAGGVGPANIGWAFWSAYDTVQSAGFRAAVQAWVKTSFGTP